MRAFTYHGEMREGICVAYRALGHSATSLGHDPECQIIVSDADPPTYWDDFLISDASLRLEAIGGSRRWAFATPCCEADNLVLVKVCSRRVTAVLGEPWIIRGNRAALVVLGLGDTIEAGTVAGASRVSVSKLGVPFT